MNGQEPPGPALREAPKCDNLSRLFAAGIRVNSSAARLMARTAACILVYCLNLPSPATAREAGSVAAACPMPSLAPAIRETPDREGAPLEIRARSLDAGRFETGYVSGEVELFRADQYLATEAFRFDPQARTVTVDTPLEYRDAQIYLDAQNAFLDLPRQSGEFNVINYGIVGSTANGSAQSVRFENGTTSRLLGIDFTTCPGETPEWVLHARELELKHDEGVGYARNAYLKLGRVPVLWAPWMTFPIDDRRKSGLLYPRFGNTNDNGLEFAIPWYWNIRPNQDATFTPRYFTDRGYALTSEYRFLTRSLAGTLDLDWLPNDRIRRETRYHYRARATSSINRRWHGEARLERVSDEEYFQDFGGSLASTSRQYLRSHAGIDGAGRYWIFAMLVDDFQVLDDSVTAENEPYTRLPRATFKIDAPLGGSGLIFAMESEAVYFDRDLGVTGARLDAYPALEFSLDRFWGFVRASAGYRYTAYTLDWEGAPGDDTPDRGLPIVSLDTGMYFDRLSADGDTITLEPRLFYLNVPFEEQSNLPDFDTAEFTFGFSQLFHYNRFTGGDRQTDANQLTLAASSRSISAANGREIWNLNIGQIIYFDPPRVTLDETTPTNLDTSPFIAELNWSPVRQLFSRVGLQWDWENSEIDLASLAVGHTSAGGHRVGFEYRFRRDSLDQFDIRYFWPINERWRVFTRVNYSLENSRLLEAIGGLEYESCCWAVRIAARRHLKNRRGDTRDSLYIELRLKGLGSVGREPPPLFYDPAP